MFIASTQKTTIEIQSETDKDNVADIKVDFRLQRLKVAWKSHTFFNSSEIGFLKACNAHQYS